MDSIDEIDPHTELVNAIKVINNLEYKSKYIGILYKIILDNQVQWIADHEKLKTKYDTLQLAVINFLIYWNSPNRLSCSIELEKAGNELSRLIKES